MISNFTRLSKRLMKVRGEKGLMYNSVKKRLGQFGLEISEEKTKMIEFGRYANKSRKERGEIQKKR